jgi:PadR family transcriptional regulator AphA
MNGTISTTEGTVLGLLAAAGESSGYELAKLADRGVGYLWTPSRSQMYRVLPRLVTSGYAQAREVEQQGRPDKALYKVTEEGTAALHRWLEEVDEEPAAGQVVFPLKLFFCDLVSTETALEQLAAYRRFMERRLASYEQQGPRAAASRLRFPEYVLGHGLARVRATLDWIDDTRAAIESGREPPRASELQTSVPDEEGR